MPLDIGSRAVDQMDIVHLHRAGRHAGQARKAAVEVRDGFGIGRATFFEHRADEIDAPARRFILIARKHIRGARVRAEPVMHARLQDPVGLCDLRIAQLLGGKIGLHDASAFSGTA